MKRKHEKRSKNKNEKKIYNLNRNSKSVFYNVLMLYKRLKNCILVLLYIKQS